MNRKPLNYAVSAGRDLLRFFSRIHEARAYAVALLAESHPNIGAVRIERWNDDAGEYRDVQCFGAPAGKAVR